MRARPTRPLVRLTAPRVLALGALLAAVFLGRCAPAGPRPIAYGKDSCAFCLMGVDDPRFAAELVTRKGKVHVFDSPECLAGYLRQHPDEKASSAWVTDFARPRALLRADQAQYRQTSAVSSPMGLGLAALAPGRAVPATVLGPALAWADVLTLAADRETARAAAR